MVVWSQRIEIRYQLGLSDNMIQQELQAGLPAGSEIPDEPGLALRLYRDVIFPKLPERISVTIDGQPQVLRMRRADIIRQHHIQIELVYRLDYAVASQPVYFLLIDDNFQGIPGYHLAAIRSRGLVDVPESNAVPVLSRLSRDPETPEEMRILNTPVRRVEAMLAAISADEPSQQSQSVPRPSTAEPTASAELASAAEHVPAEASDLGRTTNDRSRWIWPGVGSLLILAAVVWMTLVLRQSGT